MSRVPLQPSAEGHPPTPSQQPNTAMHQTEPQVDEMQEANTQVAWDGEAAETHTLVHGSEDASG